MSFWTSFGTGALKRREQLVNQAERERLESVRQTMLMASSAWEASSKERSKVRDIRKQARALMQYQPPGANENDLAAALVAAPTDKAREDLYKAIQEGRYRVTKPSSDKPMEAQMASLELAPGPAVTGSYDGSFGATPVNDERGLGSKFLDAFFGTSKSSPGAIAAETEQRLGAIPSPETGGSILDDLRQPSSVPVAAPGARAEILPERLDPTKGTPLKPEDFGSSAAYQRYAQQVYAGQQPDFQGAVSYEAKKAAELASSKARGSAEGGAAFQAQQLRIQQRVSDGTWRPDIKDPTERLRVARGIEYGDIRVQQSPTSNQLSLVDTGTAGGSATAINPTNAAGQKVIEVDPKEVTAANTKFQAAKQGLRSAHQIASKADQTGLFGPVGFVSRTLGGALSGTPIIGEAFAAMTDQAALQEVSTNFINLSNQIITAQQQGRPSNFDVERAQQSLGSLESITSNPERAAKAMELGMNLMTEAMVASLYQADPNAAQDTDWVVAQLASHLSQIDPSLKKDPDAALDLATLAVSRYAPIGRK